VKPDRLARILASGFGSGCFPVAPGTAGSAVALIIGAGLLHLSFWLLLAGCVVACLAGLWAAGQLDPPDDPGWVLIDEFAGQWIALLGLGAVTWQGLLAAFLLFRLFDIAKPGPVGWIDRRKDALGLMGDDVLAGALAALILLATGWLWPGLLA